MSNSGDETVKLGMEINLDKIVSPVKDHYGAVLVCGEGEDIRIESEWAEDRNIHYKPFSTFLLSTPRQLVAPINMTLSFSLLLMKVIVIIESSNFV